MKFRIRLSFPLLFNCLLKSFGLYLMLAGMTVPLTAQSQKISKEERRVIYIDSLFDQAESNGLVTTGKLRFEYFFSDPAKEQLENLGRKLEKDSFEITFLDLTGDKRYSLGVKKNELQSRETMYDWEKKMRTVAYKFLVDDYDGFTISAIELNALAIPYEKFDSVISNLDDEVVYKAGQDLMKKKAYTKAILAFQECANRPYKADTSHFQIGNALVATKKYVEGIEHWEQARNINPKYTEAFIKLGTIFYDNSLFNRSLFNFKKAEELDPDNDQILYQIAETLYQLELYNQAYDYATRAAKINPKNIYTKNLIDMLNQPAFKKLRKQYPDQ